MNETDQLTQTRLWIAVVNIDLQLYKASIYKLRWGTPGGIDTAIPCYDEALQTLAETEWPGEVEIGARLLGIGNRSFRSAYGVFRDGRCLATAACVSVWFDPRERRSVVPPAAVRQAMEHELRQCPAASPSRRPPAV